MPIPYVLIISLFLFSCSNPEPRVSVPDTELWQEKKLRYAKNLRIFRQGEQYLIEIGQPWQGAQQPLYYQLYPKDSDYEALPSAQALPYPLKRVLASGSAQLAFLEALQLQEYIVGFVGGQYLYSPWYHRALAEGQVADLGQAASLDIERALLLKPQVAFCFAMDANSQQLPQAFERARIPIFYIAEFLEEHPLGRLEWLWLFALLFDKEQEATQFIEQRIADYEALCKSVEEGDKPQVLTGLPYNGTWWLAGGKSFLARLIADAGGLYLWAEDSSRGGLALEPEAVYHKAKDADVWLNLATVQSKDELLKLHPRYADFEAVQKNKLYNYDKRVSPQGGYDVFESAIVEPQRLLRDLLHCFHSPELQADSLYYFRVLK